MKYLALALLFGTTVNPQSVHKPEGKWTSTIADASYDMFTVNGSTSSMILVEEYEVTSTQEVCAVVTGYFRPHTKLQRYLVQYKGMRTSSVFEFSTQFAAEHMVEKYCTAESFTSLHNSSTEAHIAR